MCLALYVESIVAQWITSPKSRSMSEAYEAFGVLWRLSGELFYTNNCSLPFLMLFEKRIINCPDFILISL